MEVNCRNFQNVMNTFRIYGGVAFRGWSDEFEGNPKEK